MEEVEHEPAARPDGGRHLAEDGGVLLVPVKVAEAGEEIDGEVHGAGPNGEGPHVGPDQRGAGHAASAAEQAGGQVQADRPRAGQLERAGMAARAAAHVERAPAEHPREGPADKRHDPLRIGVVTVRIQLEVFFAEPLLEPLGHAGTG
jgi:hypothetical protein